MISFIDEHMPLPDTSDGRKPRSNLEWVFRGMFLLLGSLMIWMTWEAIHNGYWWVRSYNPNVGKIGTWPILSAASFGAIFVLIALIPWPRASAKHKSKDDVYKVP